MRLLGWALRAGIRRIAIATTGFVPGGARRRTRALDRERHELVWQLGRLKGAFAKAGQFASLRIDLANEPLRSAFAELQDRVEPLDFETIAAVVEDELGGPLADHFISFEERPLGAASIAQVHRARLHDGTEVAVKVQYPWIADSLATDLAVARVALSLALRASGRRLPDRDRLFAEFGRSLAGELDFEREARAASEIAANLAGDDRIVVPETVPRHSTRRLLTMGYVDAIPISDREALARHGIDCAAVVEILARAYAKQVFVDGSFHADPHPGNLFVVREEEMATRPRVLFVDFGLSRRLDPGLRRELRKGLHALLQRDLDGFVRGMHALAMIEPGAEDGVRTAVGAMFERIADSGGALAIDSARVSSLKDEAKRLLAETPGLQLPNELLLYAKTVTYLFALGESLAPQVDLMKITLPHLLRFLAQPDP